MPKSASRRVCIRSGVSLVPFVLAGCMRDRTTPSLHAHCIEGCDSLDTCSISDPIPSDEEPIASSQTLQKLLDKAIQDFQYPDCTGEKTIRWGPVEGESWDDVEAVYEELPHDDILHEGYVIRTNFEPDSPVP